MTLEAQIAEAVRLVVREELARALSALPAPTDPPLDTAGAAELAQVEPKTIRRWVKSGRLPATRSGRELRLARSAVLRAMSGSTTPAEWAAEHAGGLPPRP